MYVVSKTILGIDRNTGCNQINTDTNLWDKQNGFCVLTANLGNSFWYMTPENVTLKDGRLLRITVRPCERKTRLV